MKLKNRVALVTGGATGMGRAIAELFSCEGAAVIVNFARSRSEAEEVVSGIKATGGNAVTVCADVAKDSEVRAMVGRIQEEFGRLDIVVNNAGWSTRIPHQNLEDLTDDVWDRTLNTNLRAPFYCARAAAPLLRQQAGASIVNVASVAGIGGSGSSIAYAASKAGLLTMTKSLARVLAPQIRVNAIAPGFVRTRFAGWPASAFDAGEAITPLQKLPTVEDVAKVALFLAADATAITGETIVLDGGLNKLGPAQR